MPHQIRQVKPLSSSVSGLDYYPNWRRRVVRMFVFDDSENALVEVPFSTHSDGSVALLERPAGPVWMEVSDEPLPKRINEASPTASCEALDAIHQLQIEVAELRRQSHQGENGTTKVTNLGALQYAGQLSPNQIGPGVLSCDGLQVSTSGCRHPEAACPDVSAEWSELRAEARALRDEIQALRGLMDFQQRCSLSSVR